MSAYEDWESLVAEFITPNVALELLKDPFPFNNDPSFIRLKLAIASDQLDKVVTAYTQSRIRTVFEFLLVLSWCTPYQANKIGLYALLVQSTPEQFEACKRLRDTTFVIPGFTHKDRIALTAFLSGFISINHTPLIEHIVTRVQQQRKRTCIPNVSKHIINLILP